MGQAPSITKADRSYGRYLDNLWSDRAWIARRVETISILDEHRIERRVTLDIDTAELTRRAQKFRVPRSLRNRVPIAALQKGLLLDVDVRDAASESLHIATSEVNSKAAALMLLACSERNQSHSDRTLRTSGRLLDKATTVARATTLDPLLQLLEATEPDRTSSLLTDNEREAWATALNYDEVFDLLVELAQSFLLMIELPTTANSSVEIIKFRYVENIAGGVKPFSPQRLGLRPFKALIMAPGISQGPRVHTRVVAPEGSTVHEARLTADGTPLQDSKFERRFSSERVSIYTNGILPNGGGYNYGLELKLEPRRSFFLLPAAVSIWFLTLLLALATYLQWIDERFSQWDANTDAAVTILAIIPSVTAIYFVRPGEHELISRLMSFPRMMVVFCAMSALVVAGAVAANVQPATLFAAFLIALSLCTVTASYLSAILIRISIERWQLAHQSD